MPRGNRRGGNGSGGGRGGRGRRNRYYATGWTGWQRASQGWQPAQSAAPELHQNSYSQISPKEEAGMMQSQIEELERNIKAARERLDELETNQE